MSKNILITGATSGIGAQIAHTLENNNLFLTGRRKLELKNYFSCDLADTSSLKEMYERADAYFEGKIDVLINCAGQYIYKPIEKMSLDEVDYLINLNFRSCYLLSSLVIKTMKKNQWGRIINICSISGVVGEANATLYSATKAALGGLTKALALEAAPFGITINQINPGWVETPLVEEALNEEEKQEVIDVTPQKRFVTPLEIAKMCEFLITEDARGICGQSINICAGLSCGC